jgi:hypothetical protein
MWTTKLYYRNEVSDRRSDRGGYTRGGVVGLIPIGLVFCAKNAETRDFDVGGPTLGSLLIIFFAIFKLILCFLENIFIGGFISSVANRNRFSLTILLVQPPVEINFERRFSVTRM